MTTITKTLAILCAVLLGACGGGEDGDIPADAEVRTAVCSLPNDQANIRARCSVLLDPHATSITVEYLGAVSFDNSTAADVQASRSFTITVNGTQVQAETVAASVPAGAAIAGAFTVKAALNLQALAGAQIAEVSFASAHTGGGASRITGLTRVVVTQP